MIKPLKHGLLRPNTHLEQRVKGKGREWNSQPRATLYTEYASNAKDHIDEPDSQGAQLASFKYLHSNRHLNTGAGHTEPV